MTDEMETTLAAWAAAERAGDTGELEVLLRDEFYGVGPLGFVMPKPAWIDRHRQGLVYEAFELDEVEIRRLGDVALIRARNDTRGTFQGHPLPVSVRATIVIVTGAEASQLAAVHLSFIAGTPGAPPLQAAINRFEAATALHATKVTTPTHCQKGPRQMNEMQDRVVLVTGSSRGIGAAIAEAFAKQGAAVAINGRDPDPVAAVAARTAAGGGRSFPAVADVTNYEQIEAMRDAIEQHFGPVDILIANAGGSAVGGGPVEETAEAEWRAAVDANLTATFLTIKAFLPGMKQRGRGNVITMSSASAHRPTTQSPLAYAAAKAGVEVLTKVLAVQAGLFGIRVNCLAPETILTEQNQQRIPANIQEQLAKNHPVPRLGTPQDIADAAIFLASEQSSWISGITLDIAGGSVLV
jgi:3-oxoacyl-[acyl-carrier protein] reductase